MYYIEANQMTYQPDLVIQQAMFVGNATKNRFTEKRPFFIAVYIKANCQHIS